MLTNCLAACAHLSITVSEIQRDICEKNRHFIIHPCIRCPRLGGSRQNIGTPFGVEKLERCRYPMVKKFRRYVYSFWRDPRTWQTDGRSLHDSIDRASIASRGKNVGNIRQSHGWGVMGHTGHGSVKWRVTWVMGTKYYPLSALICIADAVVRCPSVCMFVCRDLSWIVSKPVFSKHILRLCTSSGSPAILWLQFFWYQTYRQYSDEIPNGSGECRYDNGMV